MALDLDWEPIPELRSEIHDGDQAVRSDWPWQWWGLEPLDRRQRDWETRYSAVFRIRKDREPGGSANGPIAPPHPAELLHNDRPPIANGLEVPSTRR